MFYHNAKEYIIDKNEMFPDIYLKFASNTDCELRQLLVVDEGGVLVGVLGYNEISNALLSEDKFNLLAKDIMNTKFTCIAAASDLKKKCFDIFYQNNFNVIPIVSDETKAPIGMTYRKDFSEFNMISFSQFDDFSFCEDVILNYVLLDIDKIFYIDVGAFEPWVDNVTKWFSLSGRGRGINIEPQLTYFNRLKADRPNDINIHTAISDKDEELKMYGASGLTTARQEYSVGSLSKTISAEYVTVPATTLKNICKTHISNEQEIHFLKIDVEGYEKDVLSGADFDSYRPWIVMLEATMPGTEIPTHDEWEHILFSNRYKFAAQYGINRFYVSEEHSDLISRFIDIKKIHKRLYIRYLRQGKSLINLT